MLKFVIMLPTPPVLPPLMHFGATSTDSGTPMFFATVICVPEFGSRQKTPFGSEKPATAAVLDTPQPYSDCASLYVRYPVVVLPLGTMKSIACTGPATSMIVAGFAGTFEHAS